MDSFESLVGALLEREGYWVRSPYRVELTKAEKRRIGRPSSPRWELDLIAYKPVKNELLVLECKSFLDSPGVRFSGFDGSSPKEAKRYKLFSDATLRRVVLGRLVGLLSKNGLARSKPKVILGLAAGKIVSETDREKLKKHFTAKGWALFDDAWLRSRLMRFADYGYENSVPVVVTKLLLREPKKKTKKRQEPT